MYTYTHTQEEEEEEEEEKKKKSICLTLIFDTLNTPKFKKIDLPPKKFRALSEKKYPKGTLKRVCFIYSGMICIFVGGREDRSKSAESADP